jgi:hypothetical protein
MKTLLLTITALLLYFSSHAQVLLDNKLTGEWTVKNVRFLTELKPRDAEHAKQIETTMKGFLGATFAFQANKNFRFTFPKSTPADMRQIEVLGDAQWTFSEEQGLVTVKSLKEQDTLMDIVVKLQGDKTYFLLYESPILLEVVKR